MAKTATSGKQNELQKQLQKQKQKHEATLEKLKALQVQADEEMAAINKLEEEIASLRQAEQEKKLTDMAFGQGYNGDNLDAMLPELAMLFDPKTQAAALEALAAVRAKAAAEVAMPAATVDNEKTEV